MNNTYIPKFTYVIPFRFRIDRIIPLKRVLELLAGFQGIEVILVEQDKYSKISHLNLKAKHIFIKSDLPFNKSWAFNVSIKHCNSPIIICADADFIMSPNDLIESLNLLNNYDCVIPTSNIVKLSPQESTLDANNIFTINRVGEKSNLSDGLVIYKYDSLQKIGGWNEDFIGVEYENKFQDMKITNFLTLKQLNYTGYHLYHGEDQADKNLSDRNKQIFDFYQDDAFNKLSKHIQLVSPKIGFKNKYDRY